MYNLYFNVDLETPVFTSTPPSSISVSSTGASVRFNCSARGSPLPQITWYKKNVIVPTVNNVTADVVTSELAIGRFQPSDQATYTCVARNVYNDEVRATTKIGKAPMKSSVSCRCSRCYISFSLKISVIMFQETKYLYNGEEMLAS